MKYFLLTLSLLLLIGCSSKRVKVNGLICPEGHSTPQQVQKDLSECNYYDEKKAAEASHAPLKPECVTCLKEKGYELE